MSPQADHLAKDRALDIVHRLQKAGFDAFWVGGCVRDSLLGRPVSDYDVATSALPEQVETLFPHTIPVGRQFGVVIVVSAEGLQFQVATFRAEADYQDGRHPGRVLFADARADASRRDFTVNGLFYDPVRDQLHDWVGGAEDLHRRVIRAIGQPLERFAEDHLRLLRAVRFAKQLEFTIDPDTFTALRQLAPKITSISAERIRDELNKLFSPPGADRGLDLLRLSGLLEHALPEIAATSHCAQSPDYHPEGSVFNHLLSMLAKMPANAPPSLPWAVLLHDVAKPVTASQDPGGAIHFYEHEKIGAAMAEQILERLRFPRSQIQDVAQAVRFHMQFKDALKMRKSTLRRMIARPTFPLELELHRLDCLGSHGWLDAYEFLTCVSRELESQPALRSPLITGKDLKALGMASGPAMGALLAEIRERQLSDELKTREEALAWARQQLASNSPPGRRE